MTTKIKKLSKNKKLLGKNKENTKKIEKIKTEFIKDRDIDQEKGKDLERKIAGIDKMNYQIMIVMRDKEEGDKEDDIILLMINENIYNWCCQPAKGQSLSETLVHSHHTP